MKEETIVAVFDSAAHAQQAAAELRDAGIPGASVTRHSDADLATGIAAPQPVHRQGFLSGLFSQDDSGEMQDRPISGGADASGATVVTVRVIEPQAAGAVEILAEHNPIDIDERATVNGFTQSTAKPALASDEEPEVRAGGVSRGNLGVVER
jgi:hypothetical protein